jgi:RNA polymerase sigma-70 factor (ECF subfamily)
VTPLPEGRGRFAATRWSVVVRAGAFDTCAFDTGAFDTGARDALAALCATYWYPLDAWARRSGLDAEDARDATQDFFAPLIEKRDFRDATAARGRFRSYLGAFAHFLANRRAAARALKRGRGRSPLSLDFAGAEARLALEPATDDPARVGRRPPHASNPGPRAAAPRARAAGGRRSGDRQGTGDEILGS